MSRGVLALPGTSEILPRLWLGPARVAEQALARGVKVLCVLDACHDASLPTRPTHIAILQRGATGELWASRLALDQVADWLDLHWGYGWTPVLVHCDDGLERAPLALAWFLHRRFHATLNEAYAWLCAHRAGVHDRRCWLGPWAQL